jgi:hypothetical protein
MFSYFFLLTLARTTTSFVKREGGVIDYLHMNYKHGFIARIILIVIAIFVLGGGVYVFTQTKPEDQAVTENLTPPQLTSEAQTSVQQASEVEILNNGVYKNLKYGLQFQVPNNWKLMPVYLPVFITSSGTRIFGTQSFIESPDLDRVLQGEEDGSYWEWKQGAIIYISVSPSGTMKFKDLQEVGRSYQDNGGQHKTGPAWINVKAVKIAGEDALIYNLPTTNDSKETRYFAFLHNDLWITGNIEYAGSVDGQNIFNNMLSTLKFNP